MPDFATPSSEDLVSRRRALKQQRRMRNLQNIWQIIAIAGLAGSAIWLVKNPFWLLLQGHEQVVIDGNTLISDKAIHTLLNLQYPQPLFEIEPEEIAEQVQTQSPVAFVQVERRLFPPRLEITLQERQPVAVTIPSRTASVPESEWTPLNHPGFIDSEGYWMAQDTLTNLDQTIDLPDLQVRGFHPRYQSEWPELYTAIQASPVPIAEIDWRSLNNLILKTELGPIHLGIYDAQLIDEQLATLVQFRTLQETQDLPAIEYIDLSNPRNPAIKITQAAEDER
ncbi:FtsQ-type POTRA domain-containing protein [Oscillatoria sp. CS-180]|uniref:cell division protein FtsQ/DivIB n=1 Tax=Oscillatoria sp. CS-180 TaxID=3021720 RepID=UPI00232ECF60|nr:FtsQ-type POTRA domain-containing protein [Oscillatoria sp. CS-180]MDB9525295.1 FtsQ-type POTRA domain-containing protein [Oscillatoria sp. CS-180]